MRKALPILICSLFLAACGSHSGDADTASAPTPAAPATAPAAPAPSSSAASASTAATPAASDSAATPAGDGTASDNDTASAPAIDPSKVDFKDTGKWVAGKNYFVISPAQPKVSSTNKVEVVEVFSWGCPACNAYHPLVDSMRKALPDYATMEYLPAAFRPDENWVVYQRAFYAAQALGVARKSYDAVFDAAWKSGELATYDLASGRPKERADWPGIDAFAKFFAKHYGVSEQQFLGVANSFSINTKMKRADELIKSYGVPGTPTFIVDGKYRFDFQSAGGGKQAIELAQWLVAKEASGH
ncbi:thiol:disulfide interchange protein DsbA/DsbL [Oleiagrimonas soli]|uniref:Protein-disulfide isomerase n=1 Tax=Oleiagrimonas soli TaxID=1543381 RepID=A0A099CXR5_9GAMM|nr:thiol:disulfide interchange protein DsbA/DsbL [Oleiagrimonas soli]KGI78788.1 protein-disulfide isomerase [Oleiagrimonas soli]MBB6184442.1 thiol:disulfide interchange protein DsbA [Oleiagrimonas soli]